MCYFQIVSKTLEGNAINFSIDECTSDSQVTVFHCSYTISSGTHVGEGTPPTLVIKRESQELPLAFKQPLI